MIVIKSDREIELMRQAGHKLGRVFDRLAPLVVPGVSTHRSRDTKAFQPLFVRQ